MRTAGGLVLAMVLALDARAEAPERDDARRRTAALEVLRGPRSPEEQLEILRSAEAEALKYGLNRHRLAAAPVAAAGSAWINLGPTDAAFDYNGQLYYKVDSGRARSILVDPRDPNIVYLATSGGGVWKTWDALTPVTATRGPHWEPITEAIGTLSIGALAMNPKNPDSLLLGLGDPFDVRTPGFVHSDDGGGTWSPAVALSGSYPAATDVSIATSVRDIKFDPGGATVLVATNVGLFRSTQGGVGDGSTWALVNVDAVTKDRQSCWSLAYVGGQNWLLATRDLSLQAVPGRLWRSTDGGVSWADLTSALGPAASDVSRMTLATSAADANDPAHARVYLLAANGAVSDQKDVFRSDDGGLTWKPLGVNSSGSPTNPSSAGGDQPDLDIMHGQAFYNHMLVVDPVNHDAVFVGGDLSMVRSTDGGGTWDVMTDWLPAADSPARPDSVYVHADWHAATIAHVGGVAYLYGGTDGGIFRATEGAGSPGFLSGAAASVAWEDRLNRGIVSHLIYSVEMGLERKPTGACPASSGVRDILWGGFQDNGSRLRQGGQTIFNQIQGGDGFGAGLGCNLTGGGIGSNLIRTYAATISYSDSSGSIDSNGTSSFHTAVRPDGTGLSPVPPGGLDPSYNFVQLLATDLAAPAGRTYLAPITAATGLTGWVYASTDGGASWHRLNATGFPDPMKNVAADPVNAGHYAAVSIKNAYVSVDAGAKWAQTASPPAEPSTVAFDPGDKSGNTLWVGSKATRTIAGASITDAVGHLYKTTNALGAGTWTSLNTGLPNVPINVVKVDPNDSATVYVGTEIGLYRSQNGGASFSRYGTGLPLVSVTDLSIAWDGSAVRIATFGRGFWEINPSNSSPTGVYGTGDFYSSGAIDGFDLVRESALVFTDATMADYNWVGNLLGSNNSIDFTDFSALLAKLGGRP